MRCKDQSILQRGASLAGQRTEHNPTNVPRPINSRSAADEFQRPILLSRAQKYRARGNSFCFFRRRQDRVQAKHARIDSQPRPWGTGTDGSQQAAWQIYAIMYDHPEKRRKLPLNLTPPYLTLRFDLGYLYCGLAYFLQCCGTSGWSLMVLPESSRSDLYLVSGGYPLLTGYINLTTVRCKLRDPIEIWYLLTRDLARSMVWGK